MIYECSGNAQQISCMLEMLNISGTLNLIEAKKVQTCFNTSEINLGKKIIEIRVEIFMPRDILKS